MRLAIGCICEVKTQIIDLILIASCLQNICQERSVAQIYPQKLCGCFGLHAYSIGPGKYVHTQEPDMFERLASQAAVQLLL